MQPNFQTYQPTSISELRHKVLRNTYALLGLSLIPTILGALIGTNLSFAFLKTSTIIGMLGVLAVIYALISAIEKNRYSPAGIYLMLAFTFTMGLLLGPILQLALSIKNGANLIIMAGGATAAVFLVMSAIGATTKRDLSGLGNFLSVGVVVLIVAIVANLCLQIPVLHLTIAAAIALLSSLMIMCQVKVIIDGGETNYIWAALSIYLSICNLFTSLLHLLIAFSGNRD